MTSSSPDAPGTRPASSARPTDAEMLTLVPLEFIRFLEHDLRSLLSALDGWWTLLGDDDAAEYHAEARGAIQEKIDDLFDMTELIRQYKARRSTQPPPARPDHD